MNIANQKKHYPHLLYPAGYEDDFRKLRHSGNVSLNICHLFDTGAKSQQGEGWRTDEDGEHVQGQQLATSLRS